ncbi:hypothetical protein AGR13a_Lc140024 [Agrobacterium genomosp. 13 str. CFBP 6927]|uniref:Uncharacterized protein n=1 Tax=Agrobacterium genomosp. 13 str. CFBP 6927 TaxID=1183428 RepID=A0ABM9VLF3_9HYPH|nr:hypothetical protein AGR13a_Lc140024 [Agrobacterium genomosp. 13 str. CFBP 6927]
MVSLECFGDGVFCLAKFLLCLAGNLFSLSFRLKFLVAGYLAGGFLDGALCLAGNSVDPVLIHNELLPSLDVAAVDNGMMER